MLFSQIRQYVKGILANSFINKSTLDKLGEDNNGLTFNGNNIEPPQKLTSQQMQEIKDAFVVDSPRNGYPVLFDETGAEHFVGWYKYADGTKKPVYQKSFELDAKSGKTITWTLISAGIVDKITSQYGYFIWDNMELDTIPTFAHSETGMIFFSCHCYKESTNGAVIIMFRRGDNTSATISGGCVTLQYTKTTDTPQ